MAKRPVQVRIDEALKKRVQKVFERYGLDTSSAVRMFFKIVDLTDGIPLDLRSVSHHHYTPEERKTAIAAAKSMGLNVAGVDLLRSSRGPLVMEVNSSPGLEGIENATSKNVAGMIINWTEKNQKPWKTRTKGRG